jgi:TorA maturation chaperone TorD
MDHESIELVLTNRSFLLGMVARGFSEEPDQAFVDMLESEHAREEVALLQVDGKDSLGPLFEQVLEAIPSEDAASDLAHEYVRLFVGPGTLKASPWETSYETGKRVLFQPNVLELRDVYRSAGFVPMRLRQVSDDFIGIECDFVAKLAEKTRKAFLEGDGSSVRVTLSQAYRFLGEHLLVWIGDFASSLDENDGPDNFYSRFTHFAVAVYSRDEAVIEELLDGTSD